MQVGNLIEHCKHVAPIVHMNQKGVDRNVGRIKWVRLGLVEMGPCRVFCTAVSL